MQKCYSIYNQEVKCMNHTEYACTILNIDLESFKSKLESLGAENKGELLQRRYVYDYNPVEKNKWIRLRTNGKKTSLRRRC